MRLLTDAHPDDPALDMALTEALLSDVAAGRASEAVRVFRPGPTLALGRRDRLLPGFDAACAAGRRRGLTPVVRLAGGRAVAYDERSVLVEVARAEPRGARPDSDPEFAALARTLQGALARLGVRTELGELPREYCPGRFSLHLPDGPKIAGLARRVIAGAGLTTSVITIGGGPALRATIAEVYATLGLSVDPSTAGALCEFHPLLTADDVQRAIVTELNAATSIV